MTLTTTQANIAIAVALADLVIIALVARYTTSRLVYLWLPLVPLGSAFLLHLLFGL